MKYTSQERKRQKKKEEEEDEKHCERAYPESG
jgi:hypothetical protein